MFKKKKNHKLTDQELINLYCQKGDKEAIGILFERYMHLVYGICQKYLSEEDSKDAVMQIFEQLLEKIKHYEIRNFPSWLHSLTRNHCLMWHRARKSLSEAKNNYHMLMESEGHLHQENENDFEEKWEMVQMGITNLSADQQQCIRMFYLEKKCYKDIAVATGYNIKKVKSDIQNGKRNLKIFLKNNNGRSIEE